MSHASGIIFHGHLDPTQGYLQTKFGRNISRGIRETDIFSRKPFFFQAYRTVLEISQPPIRLFGPILV